MSQLNDKELFQRAVAQATDCVRKVTADQLSNKTPCREWNLGQLLNHMVYELLWAPALLAGKTIREVGSAYDGDVLSDDVQAAWNRAADAALLAVKGADLSRVVHVSAGDTPATEYLSELTTDMLIHAWDVGQGLDYSLVFDPEVAQAVYDRILPRTPSLSGTGLFDPPIDVGSDAPLEVRLLGLVGRDANWSR